MVRPHDIGLIALPLLARFIMFPFQLCFQKKKPIYCLITVARAAKGENHRQLFVAD